MDEMQVIGLAETVERLGAAAAALEAAVERLGERQESFAATAEATVGRIVATVEQPAASAREAELEQKLAEAEQVIAELRAAAVAGPVAASPSGRKTAVALTMQAKGLGESVAEGLSGLCAVDAALTSLSVEQRIAVKAEMLRSGLLR